MFCPLTLSRRLHCLLHRRSRPPKRWNGLRLITEVAFIRFVLAQRDSDSGVEKGALQSAYELRDDPAVSQDHRRLLNENLSWFEEHLPEPKRFNRSTSKGFYRRTTKGIAWFRDTAAECLARMHEVKRILEAEGRVVHLIAEERIGYVVYEDDLQVIAEPFADTRTR